MRRIFFASSCGLFLGCGVLSCSISERVSYADGEGRIPTVILQAIGKQKTEKSWVVVHLGEPFSIDRVSPGGGKSPALYEVYNYRFSKSHVRNGHLFYLFRAGGVQETVEYFHVAFDRDVVQKTWLDQYPRAQLGERMQAINIRAAEPGPRADMNNVSSEQKKHVDWKLPIFKKWFSTDKNPAPADAAKIGEREKAELSSGGNLPMVVVPEVSDDESSGADDM